ncbi:hypothetical protein BRDID11004_75310 [Bradyrhizobium diazoefficiens]|uniref:Uncharacterized protein n=1 Tax=Bradyrhizobium diazoefficiens TaxID=1355477 RepID=A0A809ZMT9_9BRAD|nr:hypothetical protein [Bradyrhizobium diazoefficiens]APO49694.1 hypothetical protein BD122_05650 [Bradyrhizobium diazoefficiens]WLA73380.1 hypothetical protein QIH77_42500 [Bradyrhizobium diazoefficiens]BBZ91340.1 hypothetical protein F07S3_11730 [Bradyrhizobium diazoefficiens]BCA09326.1 hypothetical protein BDHF08_11730 [Bradyrhizobium diazoefficiens]BCE53664.1 hypothetical protein XF5B_11760 [Bradyrhizobium diazoefficiens]
MNSALARIADENRELERLERIKELLDQQQKIELELTALREQATLELEAFATPKRKRRTKAEMAAQE